MDYPIEIDLGRKESSMNTVDVPSSTNGRKGKPRTYYPSFYIDSVEGLPALPKEGEMLVKFRRKRMSVEENSDGKETTGVTLEIRKICLPENMPEDGEDDIESALKKFAKSKGVAQSDESEEGDDDDSEDESEE